jgi:hypothetical protein
MPADADDIHTSPDRRYMLAVCHTPSHESFDELPGEVTPLTDATAQLPRHTRPRSGTISMVIFDSHRDRVFTLWKRKAQRNQKLVLSNLCWLGDSQTAMATASVVATLPEQVRQVAGQRRVSRPISVDTNLLIVSVPDRVVRTVPLLNKNASLPIVQILPALTANRALLTVAPRYDDAWQSCYIDDEGQRSEMVPIEVNMANLSGWTRDDAKVVGFAQPNSRSGWSGVRDIEIDGKTGSVTLIDREEVGAVRPYEKATLPERQVTAYDQGMPVYCLSKQVPLALPGENTQAFTASCVFLQSAVDSRDRVLVTSDGDPICILGTGDRLTLLYRAHDTVYGVPLRKTARARYEEAIRRVSRQRAFSLKTKFAVWRLQHANRFPDPGADIVALLSSQDKHHPTVDFDDPSTGKPAFTYLYTGASDGSVPLFSLKTVGGQYVCYTASLTPHWIPDGSPVPETEPALH